LKRSFERTEGLLGTRKVSRLQDLSEGGEILFPLVSQKRISPWAALTERNNVVVDGLSAGQVARPERLSELLQIALPSLKILLQLLVQRDTGNGGS